MTTMANYTKRTIQWPLLILSCLLLGVGIIGGPLMTRLYYLHGGSRRWVTTCMQTSGFPVLLIPLIFLFFRSLRSGSKPISSFFMEPKLFLYSAIIGLVYCLDNFLYSLGISYIPVSTSSLLYSTQLAFIAFFAWVIVKQKFTAFSVNSVVQLTLGAAILGLGSNSDLPAGVTTGQYWFGFFLMLASAALLGLTWPCVELCYSKSSRRISYEMVLQFQLNLATFGTIFSLIVMAMDNDFQAMGREAKEFGLGSNMYYVVLVAGAVVWQCSCIGSLGVIYCTSSLFNGIMGAVLLPLAEAAAVIAYHENFTGEKAMSLALCLWGFTSYFYGEYKMKMNVDNGGYAPLAQGENDPTCLPCMVETSE